MRSLTNKALIFVCTAMCMNCFFVSAAAADSSTYVYRGNNFEQVDGEPGVFTTKDRVTGYFTVDCGIAHPEGNCADLPYDNYFWMGAVALESVELSAGPASLPTEDGYADVNAFWFSTDADGQIVHWDIDLTFWVPSGLINVDTDKKPWGSAIDSAAALGGGASVHGNPGTWKKIGRPGKRPRSVFRDHSRIYGNGVGAEVCDQAPGIDRCATLNAWEDYDLKGTFQFTGIEISYWFTRQLDGGGFRHWWRWLFCQAGPESIGAHFDGATLATNLDPLGPECETYGERIECDDVGNCDFQQRGFEVPMEVTGEWLEPITTRRLVVNETVDFYDPGSGTSQRSKVHCNENGGELMNQGGFNLGRRDFLFIGFATQGWSNYWLRSCNNDFMQK